MAQMDAWHGRDGLGQAACEDQITYRTQSQPDAGFAYRGDDPATTEARGIRQAEQAGSDHRIAADLVGDVQQVRVGLIEGVHQLTNHFRDAGQVLWLTKQAGERCHNVLEGKPEGKNRVSLTVHGSRAVRGQTGERWRAN